jgi:hypothetical protein
MPASRSRGGAATSYQLPLGALVGTSLRVCLANLVPFVALAALTMAPWAMLSCCVEYGAVLPTPGVEFAMFGLRLVGTHVLAGALAFGVVQQLRGMPAGMNDVLGVGVRTLLPVLAVGIVTGVLIGIGVVLVVVPGLYLMTILFVAVPVTVLERRGVVAALQRSTDLTLGSRWPIFGAGVLTLVLTAGSGFALEWACGNDIVPTWVDFVAGLVLDPFVGTMPAVCYYMLRVGKENVDAQRVAAVFD